MADRYPLSKSQREELIATLLVGVVGALWGVGLEPVAVVIAGLVALGVCAGPRFSIRVVNKEQCHE